MCQQQQKKVRKKIMKIKANKFQKIIKYGHPRNINVQVSKNHYLLVLVRTWEIESWWLRHYSRSFFSEGGRGEREDDEKGRVKEKRREEEEKEEKDGVRRKRRW